MDRSFWLGSVIGCLFCYIAVSPFIIFNLSILVPKNSSDVAAWIQAVGSILAIVGAAIFPKIHDIQKQESRHRQVLKNIKIEMQSIKKTLKPFIEKPEMYIGISVAKPLFYREANLQEMMEIDFDIFSDYKEIIFIIEAYNNAIQRKTVLIAARDPAAESGPNPHEIGKYLDTTCTRIIGRIERI